MNRAYSLVTITKAVDDVATGRRIFSGWATTPEMDRVNDTIDPMGAEFTNPVTLLHQHDSRAPIGTVTMKKPTPKGIEFDAEIPVIAEPGPLKDRVDTAWGEIKAGLVRAVSIGFKALKYAFRDDGGIDFQAIAIYELSTVSVPANAGALITSVKSIDRELRRAAGVPEPSLPKSNDPPPAASGRKAMGSVRLTPPGVTGKNQPSKTPQEGKAMKTVSEHIAALEAKRAANAAHIDTITSKSIDEGRSMDDTEHEEIKGFEAENASIDRDLVVLKKREADLAKTAQPVRVADGAPVATVGVSVKAPPKPEPGIRLARYVRCLALSKKGHRDLLSVAEEQYGSRDPEVVAMVKAAVIASNTTTDAALIGNEGGWADFVEFLRPQTITGRFGAGGIPSLTGIPFRVPLITEASESTAYWVGEGKAKPMTKPSWTRTELNPLKVATIAAATMEQLRDSSPSGEVLIRNSLAKSIIKRQDLSFIDPANAGSAGVSPASILNGIAGLSPSGSDADAVRADVGAIMGAFVTANNPLMSGVWVMSAQRALRLSLMVNALGQKEFPGITLRGGAFFELPVITSQYVDTDVVALVNAEDIYLGDEGGITIDMSTEASLEMMDNPTNDAIASTPVAAELVSLWATNSVGFRAERTINWMRRRVSAVAWADNVTWGDGGGS
jgi:HK97 family phage prohead protease